MRQFNEILSGLLLLGSIFCYRAEAGGAAAKIITFDVPGSTCLPAFIVCTQAFGINTSGAVIGAYSDTNQGNHGFLREADGSFIGIDPPGATCSSGTFSYCSRPSAINDGGVIVGFYADPSGAHDYIRARDGSFTSFDAPSGFFVAFQLSINQEGIVVGSFGDANGNGHGFIRSRNGQLSLFDAPDAVNGTEVTAISPDETVVGYYVDANFVAHGFVRSRDGTILSFDPPGSQGTQAAAINSAGLIVGFYQDQNFITHGFIRLLNGSFISFDAANPPFVTFPAGITAADVVAGSCQSQFQLCGGFVRTRDGSITSFNPPSSILTVVTGINNAGLVTGWYDDVGFLQHAFIRLPRQPQLANATD